MHSARWADRIMTLETRMQELLTSHRILRNDIDLVDRNESDTCFLSNPTARGIYGSVSATMN
ncbi:hypothetical protein L0Y59_00875, partial [Candidatus Uhrbacteria bacterium]|nr:hypothetical protein [Candidatus Uhrbacteria bacterium]